MSDTITGKRPTPFSVRRYSWRPGPGPVAGGGAGGGGGQAGASIDQQGLDRLTAVSVDEVDGRGLVVPVEPVVAPLHERHDHGEEANPLLGEAVLVAHGPLLVLHLLHDPLVHQAVQALGEDVAGDAEALGELLEAAGADEGRADDHRRPPVAEDVDGARHRAVPVVEASATHVTSINRD